MKQNLITTKTRNSVVIKSQISILERQLASGQCKNPFAVKNKVKNLENELRAALDFEFLAK